MQAIRRAACDFLAAKLARALSPLRFCRRLPLVAEKFSATEMIIIVCDYPKTLDRNDFPCRLVRAANGLFALRFFFLTVTRTFRFLFFAYGFEKFAQLPRTLLAHYTADDLRAMVEHRIGGEIVI